MCPKMSKYLSENDCRVIAALRFDGRRSVIELSRITRLSTQAVRTSLRHLSDRRILKPYLVVDVSALGFLDYGIFVSAEALLPTSRRRLLDYLMTSVQVPWITEYVGSRYRYAFSVVAKDVSELDQILVDLRARTAQQRVGQSVVSRVRWHVYGERYLRGPLKEQSGYTHGWPAGRKNIDALDLKILRLLSAPRTDSLISMARKLAIPKSTLEYRIKALEKSKVIVSYAMLPDVSALGMQAYHLLVTERTGQGHFRSRFLKYVQANPAVVAMSINVGAWEYEFEVHLPSHEDIARFEADMLASFPVDSISIEVLPVLKVHKLQPLPSGEVPVTE